MNLIRRVDRKRGRVEAGDGNVFILFDINGEKPVEVGRHGSMTPAMYSHALKQVRQIHREFQARRAA